MAIGKVNAYATVEGPKVDFGDIALNAQKIQQADLDRMKSMIPEEKKSDFKIKDLDTGIKKTGNGGYDQTLTSFLADTLSENLEIDKEAERVGRYTPELIAKKQKLQNEVTGLKGLAEKFTTDTIDFSKKLEEGKLSSVDESRFDIIEDIAAKRNLEILKDDSGNTVFKVRMVGDDGSFLSDSEGKPLYKTFNDRGVARDSITKYELENGALFGNSIKELDRAKTIGAIQNNLKLRTEVRDPKGTLITTKTFLSDEDEASLNNQINGVLSNYDNLASYLYSLDREKYATPKTMEQYKKDGDIDFAVKAMNDSVKAGLGFQNKEDRTKPSVTNIRVDGDKKPSNLPKATDRAYVQVWRDSKGAQRKDISPATVFSINRGSSVKALGETAAANVIGRENSGQRRYFIQLRPISTETVSGGGSSKSKKTSLAKEFLFFNSDADDANDVLSYIINPSTGKYFEDTEEARDYIDSVMPKSKKTTTSRKTNKTKDPLGIL
jgi:hypothetical protein